MKKISIVVTTCLAITTSAFAAHHAPTKMLVVNDSGYTTNAYFHGNPSPLPVGPYESKSIPWKTLATLCYHSSGMLKASDPCAFQVYASDDNNPQQYNVAVITLYLSNGHIVNITNNGKKFAVVSDVGF
jgi:hypothetical protein